jgi:hypothetical protein
MFLSTFRVGVPLKLKIRNGRRSSFFFITHDGSHLGYLFERPVNVIPLLYKISWEMNIRI